MKQFLLVVVALVLVGSMAYAQESRPTSAQTRQSAQQLLSQAQSNISQYDATMSQDGIDNRSNRDAMVFNRIREEVEALEAAVNSEQARIRNALERGDLATPEMFGRLEQAIERYRLKSVELEAFIAAGSP